VTVFSSHTATFEFIWYIGKEQSLTVGRLRRLSFQHHGGGLFPTVSSFDLLTFSHEAGVSADIRFPTFSEVCVEFRNESPAFKM